MYSHLPYFLYIGAMLCCLEDEEFFIKTFLGVRAPSHLPVAWCLSPLLRPLGLVISFVIRIDVLNTGYAIYFTICCFMYKT
jgi:hypothetical protein